VAQELSRLPMSSVKVDGLACGSFRLSNLVHRRDQDLFRDLDQQLTARKQQSDTITGHCAALYQQCLLIQSVDGGTGATAAQACDQFRAHISGGIRAFGGGQTHGSIVVRHNKQIKDPITDGARGAAC
jgi:hypothetical protein